MMNYRAGWVSQGGYIDPCNQIATCGGVIFTKVINLCKLSKE